MGDRKLVVHGRGSHGRVVLNTALLCGWENVSSTDDSVGLAPDDNEACIISIGDNATRKLCDRKNQQTVIHPTAFIDRSVRVGDGVFIGPGAVVHVGVTVGRGAIINTGAIVEHDCVVGDWVHVASGAVISGDVEIGEGTLVGANATVKLGVTICPWSTIGVGAVVIKDIVEPGTYVGNPAMLLRGTR